MNAWLSLYDQVSWFELVGLTVGVEGQTAAEQQVSNEWGLKHSCNNKGNVFTAGYLCLWSSLSLIPRAVFRDCFKNFKVGLSHREFEILILFQMNFIWLFLMLLYFFWITLCNLYLLSAFYSNVMYYEKFRRATELLR